MSINDSVSNNNPPEKGKHKIAIENIPQKLKEKNRWLLYKLEPKGNGIFTKPPYSPKSPNVSISPHDPNNWSSFEEALTALDNPRNNFDGVGFVPIASDNVLGIDLDHCVTDGEIATWAQEIIDDFGSYAEISASGTGVRIVCVFDNAITGKTKWAAPHGPGTAIELFASNQYFTVTGRRIELDGLTTSAQLEDCSDPALDLYNLIRDQNVLRKEAVGDLTIPAGERVDTRNVPVLSADDWGKIDWKCQRDPDLNFLKRGEWKKAKNSKGEPFPSPSEAVYSFNCKNATLLDFDKNRMNAAFMTSGLYCAHWIKKWKIRGNLELDRAIHFMKERHKEREQKTKMEQPTGADETEGEEDEVYKTYRRSQLSTVTKKKLLIADLMFDGVITVLFGMSESGKSFAALQITYSIASGVPCYDREVMRKGLVYYIAAEGDEEMEPRLDALIEYYGVDTENNIEFILESVEFLTDRSGRMKFENVSKLLNTIRRKGENPVLLVIDTLAANILPAREQDNTDMQIFANACRTFIKQTGAAILLIHHTGWDDDHERGASSLRAAVTSSIHVGKKEDASKTELESVTLTCKKARGMKKKFDPIILKPIEVLESAVFLPDGSAMDAKKQTTQQQSKHKCNLPPDLFALAMAIHYWNGEKPPTLGTLEAHFKANPVKGLSRGRINEKLSILAEKGYIFKKPDTNGEWARNPKLILWPGWSRREDSIFHALKKSGKYTENHLMSLTDEKYFELTEREREEYRKQKANGQAQSDDPMDEILLEDEIITEEESLVS